MATQDSSTEVSLSKVCTRCQECKPFSAYPKHPRMLDGRGSWCRECVRWCGRRHYERNREKRIAYAAEWNRQNRGRMRQTAFYRQLLDYGITPEEYQAMSEAQDGKCAICHTRHRLVVDHCHKTMKVRGLLCQRCNKGIGLFLDDPIALRRAAKYLE